MCNSLINKLEILELDVENIHEQGHDNMEGHTFSEQAWLLENKSRAFFTLCANHNHNLVLGDMTKTYLDAQIFWLL